MWTENCRAGLMGGRTPVANAREVAKGFPHRAHLVIDGASHGYDLFYFAPGLQETMTAFLTGRPLTAARTSILPFRFEPVSP